MENGTALLQVGVVMSRDSGCGQIITRYLWVWPNNNNNNHDTYMYTRVWPVLVFRVHTKQNAAHAMACMLYMYKPFGL